MALSVDTIRNVVVPALRCVRTPLLAHWMSQQSETGHYCSSKLEFDRHGAELDIEWTEICERLVLLSMHYDFPMIKIDINDVPPPRVAIAAAVMYLVASIHHSACPISGDRAFNVIKSGIDNNIITKPCALHITNLLSVVNREHNALWGFGISALES